MTRKIGFEKSAAEKKTSIADRYLDTFRQRHKSDQSRDTKPNKVKPKTKRNWFQILFLMVWLALWSSGILFVVAILLAGGFQPFLLIWLAAALFGWFFAAKSLRKLIKGEPTEKRNGPS